jgi:FkbM family methyltransferase
MGRWAAGAPTAKLASVSCASLLPGVRFAPAERRARLLSAYGVDLVVDVGANRGQYATDLRAAGYGGRMVSFEPLDQPFLELAANAAGDARWEARRLALGRAASGAQMNVAEDSRNSSIVQVADRHLRAVPDSRTVAVESVRVERLDAIWHGVLGDARRAHLKMDTQGYELEVLCGATRALRDVVLVEAEVSLLTVYGATASFAAVTGLLARRGFQPIAFEGVLDDPDTGEMLQADAIFRRV